MDSITVPLLGKSVWAFLAERRDLQASNIYTIYKYTAVIHWLPHTKDSKNFMSCQAEDQYAHHLNKVPLLAGRWQPGGDGVAPMALCSSPQCCLTAIFPNFVNTVDANGPAWPGDPWPVPNGTDPAACLLDRLLSFRLLYLFFRHFSSWIPELLRVSCHQSLQRLFLYLPHLHEHCLPLFLSSPSPSYSRAEWELSLVALVHRQLNLGIGELTVGPTEQKRVMTGCKILS